MEQLLGPEIGVELDEGGDGGVAEAGIGVAAEGVQGGEGDGVADEGAHDAGGKLGVGQAAQRAPIRRDELRPGFGNVKTAVLREAGEEDAGEVAGGSLSAGGDVAHEGLDSAQGGGFLAPGDVPEQGQAGEHAFEVRAMGRLAADLAEGDVGDVLEGLELHLLGGFFLGREVGGGEPFVA